MTVKEQILEIFERDRGTVYSGGELALRLGVSRNAVWKAVRQLEAEGWQFDAASGRGYCLREDSDVLSVQGITRCLGSAADGLDIRVYRSITSTNTVLKEMAAEGAPEGTVLVAAEQTAGRGRMNRQFYSPSGTGLYLSVLLRPRMKAQEALFLTTAAAVAVARTVEEVAGRETGIKWVSDVFLDGRKSCGIGVNVTPPEGGFPDAIKDIAGAVFTDAAPPTDAKNRIAAGIVAHFMEYYRDLSRRPFFDEYVRRSVVVGKDVLVLGKDEPRKARALAIDESCNLRVRYEDGSEGLLSSGEVSIRQLS